MTQCAEPLPSAGAWDVDLESAWQRGSAHASSVATDARSLDVSARLLHVHAGYTAGRPWSPRVGLEYDYGSGDADSTDGRWNRFDGLFGHRRQELGPTSIYGALGRENINTVGVRASVSPSARIDAFGVYRVLRLASATDALVPRSSSRSVRAAVDLLGKTTARMKVTRR
jgi:hypothetical protein